MEPATKRASRVVADQTVTGTEHHLESPGLIDGVWKPGALVGVWGRYRVPFPSAGMPAAGAGSAGGWAAGWLGGSNEAACFGGGCFRSSVIGCEKMNRLGLGSRGPSGGGMSCQRRKNSISFAYSLPVKFARTRM